MTILHIEVLVEEPSMEAALNALLPTMLGGTSFQIYVHNGKADLLASLPGRLRGYAAWLPADYRILVIVDRDDEDVSSSPRPMTPDDEDLRAKLHAFFRSVFAFLADGLKGKVEPEEILAQAKKVIDRAPASRAPRRATAARAGLGNLRLNDLRAALMRVATRSPSPRSEPGEPTGGEARGADRRRSRDAALASP